MDNAQFTKSPIFELGVPTAIPGIPAEILDPRSGWADKEDYDRTLRKLAEKFVKNFGKYEDQAAAIKVGGPKL